MDSSYKVLGLDSYVGMNRNSHVAMGMEFSKLTKESQLGSPCVSYSTTRNVYIFPIEAELADPNAPGGKKPYSPAPILSGRTTLNVRFAILLPSNSTTSLVVPPEA